jgi:hypothetical protein
MKYIPTEVLLMIGFHMDERSLQSMRASCKAFNLLFSDDQLYREKCERLVGELPCCHISSNQPRTVSEFMGHKVHPGQYISVFRRLTLNPSCCGCAKTRMKSLVYCRLVNDFICLECKCNSYSDLFHVDFNLVKKYASSNEGLRFLESSCEERGPLVDGGKPRRVTLRMYVNMVRKNQSC